jgi:energy-coupling factor transport system permease protein
VLVGVVYPILAAASFDLWTFEIWGTAGFFALTIVSCVGITWVGIVVGDALRHAGVARLARRRPKTPTPAA